MPIIRYMEGPRSGLEASEGFHSYTETINPEDLYFNFYQDSIGLGNWAI